MSNVLTPAQRAVLQVLADHPGEFWAWATYPIAHASGTRSQSAQGTLEALRVRGLARLVPSTIKASRADRVAHATAWAATEDGLAALDGHRSVVGP